MSRSSAPVVDPRVTFDGVPLAVPFNLGLSAKDGRVVDQPEPIAALGIETAVSVLRRADRLDDGTGKCSDLGGSGDLVTVRVGCLDLLEDLDGLGPSAQQRHVSLPSRKKKFQPVHRDSAQSSTCGWASHQAQPTLRE